MKRFIFRSLAFSCTLITLLAIIAGLCAWNSKHLHTFLEGYGQKEKLLSEVPSPRIIFQGGSNVSFGINSKAVEDSMQMTTINVALQSGLGLRIMLSFVSDFCNDGDILVLSPEYEHFYGNAYGSGESMAMITWLYPEVIKYLNIKQVIRAIEGIPASFRIMRDLLMQSLDHTIGGTNNDFQNITYSSHYSYTSLALNSYGDEERHWSYPNEHLEVAVLHIPDTSDFDEEYFEEFCGMIDALESRGINVKIIPPAVYTEFYEKEKEKINYVVERMLKAGHPFEYDPVLSVYEKSDMFDTSYHLAKSGIDKRMELIIDMLRSNK